MRPDTVEFTIPSPLSLTPTGPMQWDRHRKPGFP